MEKVINRVLWLSLIMLAFVFASCKKHPKANSDDVVVNGTLANSNGKMIWISELKGSEVHSIDSILIGDEENFSFRLHPQNVAIYILSSRKNDYAIVIASKGETITVTGDVNHLSTTWTAKGSDETRLYLEYWDFSRKQLKTVDSLTFIFRNSHMTPEYMTTRIRLDSIFNAILEGQREHATRFVSKNPGSLASLLVIDAKFSKQPLFNEERDIKYYKMVDSCLLQKYNDIKLVTDFHNRVQRIIKRIKLHQETNRILPPGELSPSYMPNR